MFAMSLPLPASLTPSKVSTFKECALAFRLSAIDKIPDQKAAADPWGGVRSADTPSKTTRKSPQTGTKQ